MEKNHKIIIGVLLVVIAVLSVVTVFMVYNSLMPVESPDEVIEIGGVSFNITNNTNTSTKFKVVESGNGWKRYYENTTGLSHNVIISNLNKMSSLEQNSFMNSITVNQMKNPSQTVNGVVVYTVSATEGKTGAPMYEAHAYDNDKNIHVRVVSDDANETAKMMLSLKIQ